MRKDPYMPDERFLDVDEDDDLEHSMNNAEEDRVVQARERVSAFEEATGREEGDA